MHCDQGTEKHTRSCDVLRRQRWQRTPDFCRLVEARKFCSLCRDVRSVKVVVQLALYVQSHFTRTWTRARPARAVQTIKGVCLSSAAEGWWKRSRMGWYSSTALVFSMRATAPSSQKEK